MLEVTDLHVKYGAIHAVQGISFRASATDVVSIVGSNGAGKTTALNAMVGRLPVAGGRVMFNGSDITHWAPHRIAEAGLVMVPEGREVIAPMTVLENLELGAYLFRDQRTSRDLDYVFTLFPRLAERRKQLAGSLSGGEQQMLAIGRALMTRPKLLVMDEPSMGLAPVIVSQVFDLIKRIHADGVPIVLVEQNVKKALETASYAYVLSRGRISASGSAAELRGNRSVVEAFLG